MTWKLLVGPESFLFFSEAGSGFKVHRRVKSMVQTGCLAFNERKVLSMANKRCRSMKVQEKSGYRYKPTPAIILSGKWLAELGFDIGDYVSISCENGKLVITPDAERAALEESEAREMEILQKRFDAERRKLHAQFVAERETGYGE